MIKINSAQLWVHDQDEALAFYTQKLGWEVRSDVTLAEMGDFRWLTVGPPGQEDFGIVLMAIPGAPVMDEQTGAEVRNLMSKGFAGSTAGSITRSGCSPGGFACAGLAASSTPSAPPENAASTR